MIISKSVPKFLRYFADTQTDRLTDRPLRTHNLVGGCKMLILNFHATPMSHVNDNTYNVHYMVCVIFSRLSKCTTTTTTSTNRISWLQRCRQKFALTKLNMCCPKPEETENVSFPVLQVSYTRSVNIKSHNPLSSVSDFLTLLRRCHPNLVLTNFSYYSNNGTQCAFYLLLLGISSYLCSNSSS